MWETEDDKKTKGPREKAGGGECIYNCEPNDGMFCRVAFEKANFTGKTKGLCFKNQAWCQERCEGYVGGGSPALPPAPDSLDVDISNIGKKIIDPLLVTQPILQCRLNPTELKSMHCYIQILCRFQKCK